MRNLLRATRCRLPVVVGAVALCRVVQHDVDQIHFAQPNTCCVACLPRLSRAFLAGIGLFAIFQSI
jgi:hypothetical protein